ncbi:HNH endonuclease [Ornithinimicrobium sp. W1665]|uniref:HNH endonuclease n=1 Tax=Ornithinimicrobium sp. W1665 TaxID=3416666 RepID=UPI003CF7D11E
MTKGRILAEEFPERPLMATLSDLLGIPHFTTSRGSTVRRDFLESVAGALGVPQDVSTKDGLIRLIWECAHPGQRMPEDRLARGGTVTNRVLQEITDGLSDRVDPSGRLDQSTLDLDLQVEVQDWTPEGLEDTRSRRLQAVAVREGRDHFRTTVLSAYGGQCAASGCSTPAVLQAAHIMPYRGVEFDHVQNGISLRADIHFLFDRRFLAIHETEHVFLVRRDATTADYAHLHGQRVRFPSRRQFWPSPAALRAHRRWAGL